MNKKTYTDTNIPFLPKPTVRSFVDREGHTYGRLKVLGFVGRNKKQWALWLCQCVCENKTIVDGSSLQSGNTISCGCYYRDAMRRNGLTSKHNRTGTKIYYVWRSIKKRCYDPKTNGFPHYGGRGITMCDRWRNSFENFIADMGERPTPKHQVERINNNGNYEPDNCRWATRIEQANNRRSNRMITFNGKTQSLANWCRELHLKYSRVHNRLRANWSIEKALTL